MAPDKPRTLGDVDRVGWYFPLLLRRALASQFAIWVLLRPVCLCRVSLSSSDAVAFALVSRFSQDSRLGFREMSQMHVARARGVGS